MSSDKRTDLQKRLDSAGRYRVAELDSDSEVSQAPSGYSFNPADPEESQYIASHGYQTEEEKAKNASRRIRQPTRALGRTGITPQATSLAPPKDKKNKEDTMSKPVLFYGKPNQLDDVFTYVDIKFLVDDTSDDTAKCATLASLFRGPALQWLTNYRKECAITDSENAEKDLTGFADYATFQAKLRASFGLSQAAQTAQQARKYANCYQKASVQLYAIEFQNLAKALNIPDETAVAQFQKGLKSHIREALIINDEEGDLSDIVKEAQRIDSQLYSSKRGGTYKQYGRSGYKPASSGSGQGKCHGCGQYGHKAKDCKVKKEQPPWA